MYRFVIKHVRDAIGCKIFNVRKSFGFRRIEKNNQVEKINYSEKFTSSSIRCNQSHDDFKKKYNCKYPHNNILQALTLSTALIAVNYLSQLICLYRRNHHRLDSKKCLYSICSQQLHRKFFSSQSNENVSKPTLFPSVKINEHVRYDIAPSRFAGASSVFGFEAFFEKRFQKYYNTDATNRAFKVNNEHSHEKIKKCKDIEGKVDQVFSSITSIIGDLELKIGIEYARSGNFEEAAEHFKISTNSNNSSACYNLALLYENGFGVDKQDMTMAKTLYEMAANWGNRMAMYNLGVFYANGLGGAKKSFRRAKMCFEQASQLGDENASTAIALLKPSVIFSESEDYISSDVDAIVSD